MTAEWSISNPKQFKSNKKHLFRRNTVTNCLDLICFYPYFFLILFVLLILILYTTIFCVYQHCRYLLGLKTYVPSLRLISRINESFQNLIFLLSIFIGMIVYNRIVNMIFIGLFYQYKLLDNTLVILMTEKKTSISPTFRSSPRTD